MSARFYPSRTPRKRIRIDRTHPFPVKNYIVDLMQAQRVLSPVSSKPFKPFSRTSLWLALALYIPLQVTAGIAQREQMNFDGIAYLRLSRYIVEGRLFDSISSYWSPLITWSMAPLLAMGLDGFAASHIAMSVWGTVYLVAVFFFLRNFSVLRTAWDV